MLETFVFLWVIFHVWLISRTGAAARRHPIRRALFGAVVLETAWEILTATTHYLSLSGLPPDPLLGAMTGISSGGAAAFLLLVFLRIWIKDPPSILVVPVGALLGAAPVIGVFVPLVLLVPSVILAFLLYIRMDEEAFALRLGIVLGGVLLGGGLLLSAVVGFAAGHLSRIPLILGPAILLAIVHAGFEAPGGADNEFSFPPMRTFMMAGGLFIAVIAGIPFALLTPDLAAVFFRAVILILLAATGFSIAYLYIYFKVAGIRGFLTLFSIAILGLFMTHAGISSENRTAEILFLLVSRAGLALACLFILRQYLIWGFSAVKYAVMAIVAVASTSVCYLAVLIMYPELRANFPVEARTAVMASMVLESIVLFSLPSVIVNYNRGTMLVTWTLITLGLFLEAIVPGGLFMDLVMGYYGAPGGLDGLFLECMAYGLIALAFVGATKYVSILEDSVRVAALAAEKVLG